MNRYSLTALAIAAFSAPALAFPPHLLEHPLMHPTPSAEARTLEDASEVIDGLAAIPLKGIPPKMLADAQGVVIVPRVVKLGLVVGASGGHGVALVRTKDGRWSDPVFVHFGGGSIGLQAGIESADVVLVFRTRKGLDRILEGKGKLTLGADASVAAGPIGARSDRRDRRPPSRRGAVVLARSRAVRRGGCGRAQPSAQTRKGSPRSKTANVEERKLAEQLKPQTHGTRRNRAQVQNFRRQSFCPGHDKAIASP